MKTMKTKRNLIIIVSMLVALLVATVVMGLTGALYFARREASGRITMPKGIIIEYSGFEHATADSDNIWQANETEFKLFSNINAAPGSEIEISPATIKPASNSIDFHARFKLEYKFYTDVEGNNIVSGVDPDDILVPSASFINSAWIESFDNDGYYYFASGTTLNLLTPAGEALAFFADGAKFTINPNITGKGPGYAVDEETTIMRVDVYLVLEVAQEGINWSLGRLPVVLNMDTETELTLQDEDGQPVDGDIELETVYQIVNGDDAGLQYIFYEGPSTLSATLNPESIVGTATVYSNVGGLTQVTIPDYIVINNKSYKVTEIGDWAFESCNLTSLTIPNSIEVIGEFAFLDSDCIETVVIGNGVKTICKGAFSLAGVYNLTMGKSVEVIESQAFNSNHFSNIDLPESLTEIGESAFSYCNNLLSVEIPNSVTTLGYQAFSYCDNLNTLVIGNGVELIDSETFTECTRLKNVTFGKNVKTIETEAFYNCGIINLIIPEGVTYIGYVAFGWSEQLETVTLPNSLETIEGNPFCACPSLEQFVSSSAVYTTLDNGKLLMSGSEIIAFAPYGIADYAIPDGVTSIGGSAFSGCTSLGSIEIPDGVTSIGGSAFSGCTSLGSIEIPDSVTSIGSSAFYNCTSLGSIEIPDGVTSIASGTFSNCTSLGSIEIPNGVTSIGGLAFSGCTSLRNVTIGDGVTNIGISAFSDCTSLTTMTVEATTPPTIRYSSALPSNTILTTIYVPADSVEAYKAANVWKNYNIQAIANSSNVLDMDAATNLFLQDEEGEAVEDIEFGKVCQIVDASGNGMKYIFHNSLPDGIEGASGMVTIYGPVGQLTDVNIPEQIIVNDKVYAVTAIEDGAFVLCASLKSIIIPDTVGYLGCGAFKGLLLLETVVIGSGVTYIYEETFSDCTSLTTMTVKAATPPGLDNSSLLPANTILTTIYVPAASVEAYKAANIWKNYNIQAISE